MSLRFLDLVLRLRDLAVVLLNVTKKRNNLSLLVWADLLGAGFEQVKSLTTLVYKIKNIRNGIGTTLTRLEGHLLELIIPGVTNLDLVNLVRCS